MKVYTFSEARQKLATLLNQAWREGPVRIRRRDGQEFLVQAAPGSSGSPLDVPSLNIRITAEEIVDVVRESRRSTERFIPNPGESRNSPLHSIRRVSERARKPRSRRRK